MKKRPPRSALRFLRWFCREDYLEEIEGDLIELFEKGSLNSYKKARRGFTWNVIRSFRLRNLKPFSAYSNTHTMFKSNLKIAWRNLNKQAFFTLLNTCGLAVGLAGGLLIALYIQDEMSFDKMFADSGRIYRLNIENRTAGETSYYAAVSAPLADVIRKDYPHAEMVTQFKTIRSTLIREVGADQNIKEDHITAVDTTFFEMFGQTLVRGNPQTALSEPNSVVLTTSAAARHFGTAEAMGKQIRLNDRETYLVTGIMNDPPANSFLRDYGVFLSLAGFEDAKELAWNSWTFPTFVKLRQDASYGDFQEYVNSVKERYLIPWAMTFVPGLTLESAREADKTTGNFMRFHAMPLTSIHLSAVDRSGEFNSNNDRQHIFILSFIGLFLILLASVNFMNLSTAYSLKRVKEVGIRKTLGSTNAGLVWQFLTESCLIAFLSLGVALALAGFAIPFFNQLAGKTISLPLANPTFWLVLLGGTLFLGLISGFYPAFFLSRFTPVKVLSGTARVGGSRIRNYLVVFQFAISVFLMIGTFVIYEQLTFIRHKDLGFQQDQVLVIEEVGAAGDKLKAFSEDVKGISLVEQVSLSSFLPTPSSRRGTTLFPEGKVLQLESGLIIENWDVDHDYLQTLGLELIAGRWFDRQYSTDSTGMVVNESAIAMLGVSPEEALGMRLTDDFHREDKENMRFSTIIGVVQNFHFESLRSKISAVSFSFGGKPNHLIAKLNPGDFPGTLSQIEEKWSSIAPGQPFNYYFMDDSFAQTYKAELRLGSIFIIFTILSVFIACLGLFGLAAFNAEKRTKEIGIRKVLGASVRQIVYGLSIDFLKLVSIAVLIALPLGWLMMDRWLEEFSYRIEISGWNLVIAAILAIAVSVLTVGFQGIRAALVNPIDSLRNE